MDSVNKLSTSLSNGILSEPVLDGLRIVFWLRGDREGPFQHWERVSSVARAEIMVDQGVGAIAATSIRGKQRVGRFVGKLAQWFQGAKGVRLWVLPSGESVELFGERQTNLMLVWSEDETNSIDETRIKSRWPESQCLRRVGSNLFLVEITAPTPANGRADWPVPQGSPREVVEQVLRVCPGSFPEKNDGG